MPWQHPHRSAAWCNHPHVQQGQDSAGVRSRSHIQTDGLWSKSLQQDRSRCLWFLSQCFGERTGQGINVATAAGLSCELVSRGSREGAKAYPNL